MPVIYIFRTNVERGCTFKKMFAILSAPFVEEMIYFPSPQESGLKQIVGISNVNTLLISTIRKLKYFINSDNGGDEAYILNLFISLLIIMIKETTLAFDKAEEDTLLLLLTILNNMETIIDKLEPDTLLLLLTTLDNMVKLNNNNNKWYKALEKTLHDVHRVYGNTYTYNMDIVEKIEQRRNEDIVRSIDKREKITEKLNHILFYINKGNKMIKIKYENEMKKIEEEEKKDKNKKKMMKEKWGKLLKKSTSERAHGEEDRLNTNVVYKLHYHLMI